MVLLDVRCPDHASEGDTIAVLGPGGSFEVVVPTGVPPGSTFQVDIAEDVEASAAAIAAAPTSSGATPQPAIRPALPEALIDNAIQRRALGPHESRGLRAVLHALYDDDELDDFLDDHCAEFERYTMDGEQQLEWSAVHSQYVELMEARIEAALRLHGANSEQLYALLRDVGNDDARVNSFISRVLNMGDYSHFCATMLDRLTEVRALEKFQAVSLDMQLSMTRLDSQLGMD